MDLKNNRLILTALGVAALLYLLPGELPFGLGGLAMPALGMVLLLMFWTKRMTMAAVAGTYLMVFGLGSFGRPYLPDEIGAALPAASWFLSPGALFLILYRFKSKLRLIVPAYLFLGTGAFILLRDTGPARAFGGPLSLLLLFLAIGYLAAWLTAKAHVKKGVLITSVVFFVLAVLTRGI